MGMPTSGWRTAALMIIGAVLSGCATPLPASRTPLPLPASSIDVTPIPRGRPTTAPQAAWLPPWSGEATPDVVRSRTVLPLCGVEDGPAPFVRPNAEARDCLWRAWQAAGTAEFARVQYTIEGDPIATIVRVLPDRTVEILRDTTQDQFGSRVWTRETCTGLERQAEPFAFTGVGCKGRQILSPA